MRNYLQFSRFRFRSLIFLALATFILITAHCRYSRATQFRSHAKSIIFYYDVFVEKRVTTNYTDGSRNSVTYLCMLSHDGGPFVSENGMKWENRSRTTRLASREHA